MGVAFLISSGISYSFQAAPLNNRDVTPESANLVCYPPGRIPFSICNVYRPPTTYEGASFNGMIYTADSSTWELSITITNYLALSDFNLELKGHSCRLADTNHSEWAHVRNPRGIPEGDPTMHPSSKQRRRFRWPAKLSRAAELISLSLRT